MLRAVLLLLVLPTLALALACRDDGRVPPEGAAAHLPTPPAEPAPQPTSTPGPPVVVIDPGHGGEEVGAANHGVVEKDSNLDMAMRLERLLAEREVRVVLTRREDTRASGARPDGSGVSFGETRADLQARVDLANAEDADLFVSLHSNGSTDQTLRGIEVYYDPHRPFAASNAAFAQAMLDSVVSELAAAGFGVTDRGVVPSDCIRVRDGRCFPLFILGPERAITRKQLQDRGLDPAAFGFAPGQESIQSRATGMPGVLMELLFISNAQDAAILRDDAARDAMARGMANAITAQLDALGR